MGPTAPDGRPLRLDTELVRRGLARSRTQAQSLIATGRVRVEGRTTTRASLRVDPSTPIEAEPETYVSRAAHKLIGALDDLRLDLVGRALDAGSSTGGFTQVLLERGCRHVTAVDVGTNQLAPVLRADSRVTLHEQTNLRALTLAHVGGRPVDVTVADLSFISLTLLMPVLTAVTDRSGQLLLLVKPQFEVGRERLGPGGVVRSAQLHREAVAAVLDRAGELGWPAHGAAASRLPGADGNREFFVLLRSSPPEAPVDLQRLVGP
jgi:23S rRNA (cytidine1920-2'-O)/16S rRNA (cytidine1409-2'-O)-methyltransferase